MEPEKTPTVIFLRTINLNNAAETYVDALVRSKSVPPLHPTLVSAIDMIEQKIKEIPAIFVSMQDDRLILVRRIIKQVATERGLFNFPADDVFNTAASESFAPK